MINTDIDRRFKEIVDHYNDSPPPPPEDFFYDGPIRPRRPSGTPAWVIVGILGFAVLCINAVLIVARSIDPVLRASTPRSPSYSPHTFRLP